MNKTNSAPSRKGDMRNCRDKHKNKILCQREVCPQDLRFTQDSIKNTFQHPYESVRIDEVVDQIQRNLLSPRVFPPLDVVDHRNILWSLDNRRLWVFRKAGVAVVQINLVPPNFSRRSEEFFCNLNRVLEIRYASLSYFPRVRGPISVSTRCGPGRLREITERIPPQPNYARPEFQQKRRVAEVASVEAQCKIHDKTNRSVGNKENAANLGTSLPSLSHRRPTIFAEEPSTVQAQKIFHKPTGYVNVPLQTKNVGNKKGGKKAPCFWEKVLNSFNSFMDKSFGFLHFIADQAFDLGDGDMAEKVVRFGRNAFLAVGFCLMARQALKFGKRGGDTRVVSCPDFIVGSGEKVMSGQDIKGNLGEKDGSCSDNGLDVFGTLGYISRQAVVIIGRMVFAASVFCLRKMLCLLRFVCRWAFYVGKGVVVSSGRKVLCAFGVAFSWFRVIARQAVERLGESVVDIWSFCWEKFVALLWQVFNLCFGDGGQKNRSSVSSLYDKLSFCFHKISEIL